MKDGRAAFATAQQYAYSYVRDQILSGNYSGGTHLDPKKIAETLSVSRMPVREALRQLDAEGLVVMRPNRGAVVTSLTSSEVEEIFEMRAALEVLAVRFAMTNLDGEAISELEALKDRMDRVRHDRLLWIRRHNEFHQFISGLGRRTLLAAELSRLRTLVQPYLLMYIDIYGAPEMEGYEHDELLAAIVSKNVKRAENRIREHVRRASIGVITFLEDRQAALQAAAAPQNAKPPLARVPSSTT